MRPNGVQLFFATYVLLFTKIESRSLDKNVCQHSNMVMKHSLYRELSKLQIIRQ